MFTSRGTSCATKAFHVPSDLRNLHYHNTGRRYRGSILEIHLSRIWTINHLPKVLLLLSPFVRLPRVRKNLFSILALRPLLMRMESFQDDCSMVSLKSASVSRILGGSRSAWTVQLYFRWEGRNRVHIRRSIFALSHSSWLKSYSEEYVKSQCTFSLAHEVKGAVDRPHRPRKPSLIVY